MIQVILICGDTLSSCYKSQLVVFLSNGCIWCYWSTNFSKITNVEECQVIDQAKIALTLVQSWICKNDVIDLNNTKIAKNHYVKRILFQIHYNKSYSKNYNMFSL